jgi:hypothetical protein
MEVAARPESTDAGERKGLTGRVHLTERDESECDQLGRSEPKRRTHFYRNAIDTWARWAGEEGFGLRGWLGQRPSGLVRPAGPKARSEWEKGFLD